MIPPENSSTAPAVNNPTGTLTSIESAIKASGQNALNISAPDTDAFIDVMVVYTPAARTAAGGTTAMQAHVNLLQNCADTYMDICLHVAEYLRGRFSAPDCGRDRYLWYSVSS